MLEVSILPLSVMYLCVRGIDIASLSCICVLGVSILPLSVMYLCVRGIDIASFCHVFVC